MYCPYTEDIRQKYIPQCVIANPMVARLTDNEAALMISILDPESSLLPDDVRFNWESSKKIYTLTHDYVNNVHKQFEKFFERKNFDYLDEKKFVEKFSPLDLFNS